MVCSAKRRCRGSDAEGVSADEPEAPGSNREDIPTSRCAIVSDNKYGRIFTEGDVEKILERYDPEFAHGDTELVDLLDAMDKEGVRFKFSADEPTFTFRARDKRAAGAIKHYLDHQAPNAPTNHIEGIMRAFRSFNTYREQNPGQMREPD